MLNNNTWNRLIMCKQMSSGSFRMITYKLFIYKSHTHAHEQDLALNKQQGLLWHKTQTDQPKADENILIFLKGEFLVTVSN